MHRQTANLAYEMAVELAFAWKLAYLGMVQKRSLFGGAKARQHALKHLLSALSDQICISYRKKHPKTKNYRVAIKTDQIMIYEGIGGGMDSLRIILGEAGLNIERVEERLQKELDRYTQFTPVMRFIPDDQETREYHAERWCYSGSR